MNNLELRLQQAVKHYRAILERIPEMAGALGKNQAREVEALVHDLQVAQGDAERIHRLLNGTWAEETLSAGAERLAQELLEVMEEICRQNRTLGDNIRTRMSVVAAEMSQLNRGRKALAGYKTGQPTTGNVIRGNG